MKEKKLVRVIMYQFYLSYEDDQSVSMCLAIVDPGNCVVKFQKEIPAKKK
jgi:hypothetical protein